MPVNREELLAKLAKMGMSKTNMYRMNHGIVAVEEFVARESMEDKDQGVQIAPGSLVLTAEEVAFMVLDFAGDAYV
jgi:hypothetical protein